MHQFVQLFELHVLEAVGNNLKPFSSHSLRNRVFKDIVFLFVTEVNRLAIVVKGMRRKLENIFWGTFNINSNIFWVSWNLSDNRFSLQVLIKWKLTKLWRILVSVNDFLMKIFFVIA